MRAAVEAGIRGEQDRHRIAVAKLPGLLRVGVINAVLVDPQAAVRPIVGHKRLPRNVERARAVGERLEPRRAAEFEQVADEVAALVGRQGREHVGRHERADVGPLLDLDGRHTVAFASGVHDDHGLQRLLLDDALEHAAIGEREGVAPILGLHGPGGPVDALDDLLGRKALGDRGELGAHSAPFPRHLVARRAARRGHTEHAGPTPGVTLRPRVGQGLLDECGVPLGWSVLPAGSARSRECGQRDHDGP